MQNCKPESTESLVERNGVGGDTAVRKVGGWAKATYAWAMTRSRRRRCGNCDERDAQTLWIANAHSHATKLTRNGVACYSVMRVARAAVGGGDGGGSEGREF